MGGFLDRVKNSVRRYRGLFVGISFLTVSCLGQKESLLIGPGDQVHVHVLDAPDLDQHARITDAGDFPLVTGDNVKLAGLSPSEAAASIERALIVSNYVLHPHVSVNVDQFVTQNVSVMGQVHAPGAYPLVTPRSVLDVLAMAGGVSELADRKITIDRRGTKEQITYFLSNRSSTAIAGSVKVYPGDLVYVPKVDVVYVLGDVGRPGGYPMSTNDSKLTVLQAVALAGSTPPSAVPSKSRLIRKLPDGTYRELHLSLSAMQKGKQEDMSLEPNDIIYVPFSYVRNMGSGLAGIVSSATTASIYRY
jgi:polysaccharide biosynthesis/export protein